MNMSNLTSLTTKLTFYKMSKRHKLSVSIVIHINGSFSAGTGIRRAETGWCPKHDKFKLHTNLVKTTKFLAGA